MTVNEVELIGGPKDKQKIKVPNIDQMIRLPVYSEPKYDPRYKTPIQDVQLAVYQRNIFVPEFFNFLRLEEVPQHEPPELDTLDAGLEPPE